MSRGTPWLVVAALGSTVLYLTVGFAEARAQPAQQPMAMAPLVFDGVTVIDVQQGRRLPPQRVVIIGNRIHTMGSMQSVPMPVGAHVVDARGKYLIPGLWDMHVHPEYDVDWFYPLFLANGVTGIRDAGSLVPLDTLRQWRREILAGTRVGPPRQLFAGPAIDEATPCIRDNGEHICVADAPDARHVVDSLKADGADFIKTYRLGRDLYFAIAAEARKVGIAFGGHLTAASAIEASDSGAKFLDHINSAGDLYTRCFGDSASVGQCQPAAEHFRRNGTWLVPTLYVLKTAERIDGTDSSNHAEEVPQVGAATQALLARAYQVDSAFWRKVVLPANWFYDSANGTLPAMPRSSFQRDTAARSKGAFRITQRVGLPMLAGTDVSTGLPLVSPGFSLHTELAIYVTEGMTPLAALQTATLNPANALHETDSLGTVAPGKLADLVLLDADPLVDITNTTAIRAVVANGRYFDRAALDRLLATVQTKDR